MRFIEKVKELNETIKDLLEKYPRLRDNDNALIANVWSMEVNLNDLLADEFLTLFSNGKLSSSESITRARRKVQEDNKNLRGNTYKKRKKEEDYTRININSIE